VEQQPALIRAYEPGDLDDLYRICLLTADNGGDGSSLFTDPQVPGHCYAAPYAIIEPSFAFVAEDSEGVAGYVVGALDSAEFEQRLEQEWWPLLRVRYPDATDEPTDGLSPQEQTALHNIHHPWRTDPRLLARYPSHLHINLLPRQQGRGVGRQLIATLTSTLVRQGSPGLHLFVHLTNTRARGFYQHVGFTELPEPDNHAFVMDLSERPA